MVITTFQKRRKLILLQNVSEELHIQISQNSSAESHERFRKCEVNMRRSLMETNENISCPLVDIFSGGYVAWLICPLVVISSLKDLVPGKTCAW